MKTHCLRCSKKEEEEVEVEWINGYGIVEHLDAAQQFSIESFHIYSIRDFNEFLSVSVFSFEIN